MNLIEFLSNGSHLDAITDIKGANVLVDTSGCYSLPCFVLVYFHRFQPFDCVRECKLADFGGSQYIAELIEREQPSIHVKLLIS